MKQPIENLMDFTISGTDGEIGKVKDFYFDDKSWTIRYLIVETGSWLSGRKVLLSPQAVTQTDWNQKLFNVLLTMEQIKNSPDIDTEKPVSRQHERDLYSYYPWGGYYLDGGLGLMGMNLSEPAGMIPVVHDEMDTPVEDSSNGDTHLRSTNAVTGYNLRATDGNIGDVEDFLINDTNWQIDFILVDTGNWFPGKKVLISPQLIKEISWEDNTVLVNATEEQVKNSPEYNPGEQLTERYEADLQNYYGKQITPKQ